MTNDLRDENMTEEAAAPAGAVPEETAAVLDGAAVPEGEKTVFSPSRWERRREEKAARGPAPKETAAELEARRLELRLAQENRKAEEENRRRERRAEEEERRRQRKDEEEERRERERQRKEEDRQRREEDKKARQREKAEQSSVRRVGTMTLGIALIAMGAIILAYMINPSFDIRIVAYLAPVILIGLGAEILLRQLIAKGKPFRYDFASGVICILLVIGSFAVSLVPYLLYYISPERFSTQEEQLNLVRDQVYAAFQGEQRVRDYRVYGNVNEVLTAAHVDENGKWTYQLDYLAVEVDLMDGCADETAFAGTCRQLLDRLQAQGLSSQGGDGRGDRFVIRIGCPENDKGISYNLWVNNRLKMDMDTDSLAKLVDATYSRPTRENGWIPDGYEELRENFGEIYAEHYAELMEKFGPEEAGQYYTVLVETYLVDMAEMYYNGCINGPVMAVPDGAGTGPDGTEDEGENQSVPVDDGPRDETEDENRSFPVAAVPDEPIPLPEEMPAAE